MPVCLARVCVPPPPHHHARRYYGEFVTDRAELGGALAYKDDVTQVSYYYINNALAQSAFLGVDPSCGRPSM